MTFTDDDLKRLKDCVNGYGEHGDHEPLLCFKEPGRRLSIEALLARLVEAENCARELSLKFPDCPSVEAWRKAAGK